MQRIAAFARQTKKHVVEWNLFEDSTCHSDPFHLRTAILSTRIYIVLLAISVITLIVFNSLGTQLETITITKPSELDYEKFLNKNGNLSLCPCNQITISYATFTSLNVDYHPVCESIFVSDDWINRLFSPNFTSVYQLDFRALASNYFHLLATFCSHTKRSVQDALDNLYLDTFLTPDALSKKSLDAKTEAKSQFLKLSIANSVRQLLQLVRNTTLSNVLQTAIPLSTIMYMTSTTSVDILQTGGTLFRYTDVSICTCDIDYDCLMSSGFFNISQRFSPQIQSALFVTPLANVSGFFLRCFPLESLLQSTLECLFDSSCLKIIHNFIPSSNITGIYALNTSQTQFPQNTSIEILIGNLFIEKWSMKPNFSKYYAQCSPIRCTHTLSKQNDLLYVLTKLLGLYGGLTIVLRFFVQCIVTWWRKRKMTSVVEPRPSKY